MGKKQPSRSKRRLDAKERYVRDAVVRHIEDFRRVGLLPDEAEPENVDCSHCADVWAGMGTINEISVRLSSGAECQAIVKYIQMPACSTAGERRKRDSYGVEADFFGLGHAQRLHDAGATCPLPIFIERSEDGMELLLCMSRLEGVSARRLSSAQADAALKWLAKLHAIYWGVRADQAVAEGGLQPQGSYWYLDTRLEEYARMPHDGWQGRLRLAARGLDARLKADKYQTVVHGDAKTENMLFTSKAGGVAARFFDFQYTGKAHPAKDLAYFLTGVVDHMDESVVNDYLSRYLSHLAPLLLAQGDAPPTLDELHAAYGLCVCDLARWMSGWGWMGFEGSMRRRCKGTLDAIDGGSSLESEDAYMEAIFKAFPV